MADIPLVDHRRLDLCDTPKASARYLNRLWICGTCGQGWVATVAPTTDGHYWRWAHWPRVDV
jgi:hypothetical protein